jgi:hypothetical protein
MKKSDTLGFIAYDVENTSRWCYFDDIMKNCYFEGPFLNIGGLVDNILIEYDDDFFKIWDCE